MSWTLSHLFPFQTENEFRLWSFQVLCSTFFFVTTSCQSIQKFACFPKKANFAKFVLLYWFWYQVTYFMPDEQTVYAYRAPWELHMVLPFLQQAPWELGYTQCSLHLTDFDCISQNNWTLYHIEFGSGIILIILKCKAQSSPELFVVFILKLNFVGVFSWQVVRAFQIRFTSLYLFWFIDFDTPGKAGSGSGLSKSPMLRQWDSMVYTQCSLHLTEALTDSQILPGKAGSGPIKSLLTS